jgi:hypothetical protein
MTILRTERLALHHMTDRLFDVHELVLYTSPGPSAWGTSDILLLGDCCQIQVRAMGHWGCVCLLGHDLEGLEQFLPNVPHRSPSRSIGTVSATRN